MENPGGAGRANPASTLGGGGGSAGSATGPGQAPMGTGSVLYTAARHRACGRARPGCTRCSRRCWGAGGGGGCGTGSGGGQGAAGGGGEHRRDYISVTPGLQYAVVVGAGGLGGTSAGASGAAGGQSSFTGDDSGQVVALAGGGGQGGYWGRGGGGPGGWGGIGYWGWQGGKGGPAYPYTGGGGSCAAPGCHGNDGGSPGGAIGPPGGGGGGSGSGSGSGAGTPGVAPGGGGGGTYSGSYDAGNGAAGQVRLVLPVRDRGPDHRRRRSRRDRGAPAGPAAGHAGTAGSPGSAPGGGGGGADSGGTTVAGGTGATGQIKITPYSPQPFKSLIVHRPPLGAPKSFQPLVSVGGGSDVPNGATQYVMPQLVSGVQADFQGTYTVYLVNATWNGTSARTITVTVTQAEYGGGATYTTSTIPVTVTPSQVTNGILTAGVLTLPVKQLAADNTAGYFSVSVTDTNTSDRFYDCIFLDTQGSTVCHQRAVERLPDVLHRRARPDRDRRERDGLPDRPARRGLRDRQRGHLRAAHVHRARPTGTTFFSVYSADGVAPSAACSFFPRYFFDRFQ